MIITKGIVEPNKSVCCDGCDNIKREGEKIIYISIGGHISQICEECGEFLEDKLHENLF